MSVSALSGSSSLASPNIYRPNQTANESGRQFSLNRTPENSEDSPKTLLSGLGLDGLLSQSNIFQSMNFSSSRADFAMAGDGFRMRGFTEHVSFGAQFQNGDQLMQVNIEVRRSVVQFAASSQFAHGYDTESLLARLPDDARNLVESYMKGETSADFFSPESTADRITSFALRGFSFFEGGKAAAENDEAARQRYIDYIAPAINKGFQEALDILGALPEKTQQELQQTREHIQKTLEDFVSGREPQEA